MATIKLVSKSTDYVRRGYLARVTYCDRLLATTWNKVDREALQEQRAFCLGMLAQI